MSVVAGLASYSAAVAVAAAFAVSTTVTHRSAGEVPDAQGFQPRQLLGFIRANLAHPYWLGGIALSMVGLGLHAFALNGGALAVVQLLMVLGLLFALPLQRRLRHERIPRTELWWAFTLARPGRFPACGHRGRSPPPAANSPPRWRLPGPDWHS